MAEGARDLFARFTGEQGLAAIRAIGPADLESPRLDFKENRDRTGAHNRLESRAREIFSETASAFANTYGGVILWGVQKKNKREHVLCPIPDAATFAEQLHNASNEVLEPVLAGIDHVPILEEDGLNGYVASYIPNSESKPHQAVVGCHTYYFRTGDNTAAMPHEYVRALMMAGARPELYLEAKPHVFRQGPTGVMVEDGPISSTQAEREPRQIYELVVEICFGNRGLAMAEQCAVALEVKSSIRHVVDGYENVRISGATGAYDAVLVRLSGGSYYPGTRRELCHTEYRYVETVPHGERIVAANPLKLRYCLYARNYTQSGEILIPGSEIFAR